MNDSIVDLDLFLDHFVETGARTLTTADSSLARTVRRFHELAPQVGPDRDFSQALRAKLLSTTPFQSGRMSESRAVSRIDRALLQQHRPRFRTYAEIAALILIMLPALWLISDRSQNSPAVSPTAIPVAAGSNQYATADASFTVSNLGDYIRMTAVTSLKKGDVISVSTGTLLRTDPDFLASGTIFLTANQPLTIVGGPVAIGGADFWQVSNDNGASGWVSNLTLAPETAVTVESGSSVQQGGSAGGGNSLGDVTDFSSGDSYRTIALANLRLEPGSDSVSLGQIQPDTQLLASIPTVAVGDLNWVNVTVPGTTIRGWIDSNELVQSEKSASVPAVSALTDPDGNRTIDASPGSTLTVTQELTLRADSNADSNAVQILPVGTDLTISHKPVVDDNNIEWVSVTVNSDGSQGWIMLSWPIYLPEAGAIASPDSDAANAVVEATGSVSVGTVTLPGEAGTMSGGANSEPGVNAPFSVSGSASGGSGAIGSGGGGSRTGDANAGVQSGAGGSNAIEDTPPTVESFSTELKPFAGVDNVIDNAVVTIDAVGFNVPSAELKGEVGFSSVPAGMPADEALTHDPDSESYGTFNPDTGNSLGNDNQDDQSIGSTTLSSPKQKPAEPSNLIPLELAD